MFELNRLIQFALLVSLPVVYCASAPLELPFNSTHVFGPDGPWQAVPVSLGNPPQIVNLLPGGTFFSAVPNHQLTGCSNCGPGAYNNTEGASSQAYYNISFAPDKSQLGGPVLENINATTLHTRLDVMSIPDAPAFGQNVQVPLFDMMTGDWKVTYPNGRTAPLPVGFFSFGTPNGVQGFGQDQGYTGEVNGTYLYATAFKQGKIPSQSWTLHYGSATLGIPGSFYMGGYDQSRVIGDPAAWDATNGYNVDLKAISLGVPAGGSSVFSANKTGLLQAGDSSRKSLSATIEAQASYLYLPTAICDAMTEGLPVKWNQSLQLYTWETNSANYKKLNSSATWFDFEIAMIDPSQTLSIKVPIQLLMLTLEYPIVDEPTKYFPCRRQDSGTPVLGRAFLQAAFFGQNWGMSTFFLAQAPGPNLGGKSPKQIAAQDKGVTGSNIDFATTWSTVWKDAKISPGLAGAPSTTANTHSKGRGLSGGVIAGAVIGSIAGIAALVALYYFWLGRRLRKWRGTRNSDMPDYPMDVSGYRGLEKDQLVAAKASEVEGDGAFRPMVRQQVFEAPVTRHFEPVVSELPARY